MQNDLHDHIECRITLARTSAAGFVVSAGNEGRGCFRPRLRCRRLWLSVLGSFGATGDFDEELWLRSQENTWALTDRSVSAVQRPPTGWRG